MQRKGLSIRPERNKKLELPPELAEAKREATKRSRLEKVLPMIRDGQGLHDKYRNC